MMRLAGSYPEPARHALSCQERDQQDKVESSPAHAHAHAIGQRSISSTRDA
jgi:hypothetical protein